MKTVIGGMLYQDGAYGDATGIVREGDAYKATFEADGESGAADAVASANAGSDAENHSPVQSAAKGKVCAYKLMKSSWQSRNVRSKFALGTPIRESESLV